MTRNYFAALLAAGIMSGIAAQCFGGGNGQKAEPSAGKYSEETATARMSIFNNIADIAYKGGKMTAAEAGKTEEKIAKNPEDLDASAKILGYYLMKRHIEPVVRKKREALILALIKNHPESPILQTPYGTLDKFTDNCAAAQKLWAGQAEKNPKNVLILINAAAAALIYDSAAAEKYLLQAQALEPENPDLNEKLAQVYQLRKISSSSPDGGKALAEKEFAELSKACQKYNSLRQEALLDRIAKAALESGKLDLAENYAEQMIKLSESGQNNWNSGNLFYYGYFVKGMIAAKKATSKKPPSFY